MSGVIVVHNLSLTPDSCALLAFVKVPPHLPTTFSPAIIYLIQFLAYGFNYPLQYTIKGS